MVITSRRNDFGWYGRTAAALRAVIIASSPGGEVTGTIREPVLTVGPEQSPGGGKIVVPVAGAGMRVLEDEAAGPQADRTGDEFFLTAAGALLHVAELSFSDLDEEGVSILPCRKQQMKAPTAKLTNERRSSSSAVSGITIPRRLAAHNPDAKQSTANPRGVVSAVEVNMKGRACGVTFDIVRSDKAFK
jgi:hypothetical protein